WDEQGVCCRSRPKICQFTAYVTSELEGVLSPTRFPEESRNDHLPVFQGDMTEIKSAMTSRVRGRRRFHPPNSSILIIRPFLKQG
ncbi:hypothetical protein J6590_097059, partial [Homalodisca vitripennis]